MFETWPSQFTAALVGICLAAAYYSRSDRIAFAAFLITATWIMSQIITFFMGDLSPRLFFFMLNMMTCAGMFFIGSRRDDEERSPKWALFALASEVVMLPSHLMSQYITETQYIGWVNVTLWTTIASIISGGLIKGWQIRKTS